MDIRKMTDEEIKKELYEMAYWNWQYVEQGLINLIRQCVKDSTSEGMTVEKMSQHTIPLVDEFFPKGRCAERGKAIVLHAKMLIDIHAAQEREEKDRP